MRNLLKYLTKLTLNSSQHRFYSHEVPQALRSVKGRSTRNTVQYYVDHQRVKVVGGNGGDGCVSFMHAWCKDNAGPDGGDGGNGGHVIFKASSAVRSLNHIRPVIRAEAGERGYNKECHGKSSPPVTVAVPTGTVVKDSEGRVVCDLSTEGAMWVAARGGAGGRGNQFFLTAVQQAPDIAEYGAEGESLTYTLELRSMAHIGLIGFPNAGKSTLLRAISRARPTVAPYPFTTRRPHVGMVPYSDYEQVAVADLPGLIPGSHNNYGLGIQFLKHVERCCGLLYIIDGSTDNAIDQYWTLHKELQCYSIGLTTRPCQIVINKIDVPEGRRFYDEIRDFLSNGGRLEEFGKNSTEFDKHSTELSKNTSENAENETKNTNERKEFNNLGYTNNKIFNSNLNNNMFNRQNLEITANTGYYERNSNIMKENASVIGISAKTGEGVPKLLAVVRKMYDLTNSS